MRQNARVTFAMRDLDRLKCIQAVVDGDLKPVRAAERLGLTSRQVRRLARRYAAQGPVGLIPRSINRPSNNRLDDVLATEVIKILRSTYRRFWTNSGYREAQNQAWDRSCQGDGAAAADRLRALGATEASSAKDSPAAAAPSLRGRANTD